MVYSLEWERSVEFRFESPDDWYRVALPYPVNNARLTEMNRWIVANTRGLWYTWKWWDGDAPRPAYPLASGWRRSFKFQNQTDAVFFKLRWFDPSD